ncbi:hypothetical protein KI809_10520 [Geobacter pelophilus]|uniref:Uncharacterized protein n=1 Tax=Geoanaerobacter pelophilus TaxID=60036 RepID=A0AAW4L6R9_9BACT|nr:hypothetical protein [Geoanaerobacter pelophilus]MBT0664733.1 hypothetical protein [Geoanaerobacter pelophilus]
MLNEKLFTHAVTITAAFIANGDIRCGGSTRENSQAMAMMGDMITTAYKVLAEAQDHIKSGV